MGMGPEGPDGASPPGGGREPDRDIVFHYSRERRLEKAPASVRALYEDQPGGRGFLRSFRSNPSGLWILILIALVGAFMAVLSMPGRDRPDIVLGGNRVSVRALAFPGATHLVVVKKAGGEGFYTGTVELAASVPRTEEDGEMPPVETRQVFFSLEREEDFRLSLPFEAEELILVIRAGDSIRRLRIRPE